MYIIDGIAYAGEIKPMVKVCGVRPFGDYMLWLRFNTDETKIFDFKPMLDYPVFSPLKDKELFASVYIDHGATVWDNGNIDIDPAYLYENSQVDTDNPQS